MKTSKHKRVMHYAHIRYAYEQQLSVIGDYRPDWSGAVRDAWRTERVREALLGGVVALRYYNRHGDELERMGTLSGSLIPSGSAPKGVRQQEIAEGLTEPVWRIINYYDLDQQGWRSLDVTNLISARKVECRVVMNYSAPGEKIY